MAGLAVNVDHIATLREARKVSYPEPVAAAVLAELAGADGIVVHLRKDRRHIQDRDVRILRKVVQTKLILEMASTSEMVGIALDIKPDLVTLVPEKKEELTTEGGLDLFVHKNSVANASTVEIHTGTFCDATTPQKRDQAFDKIVDAVKLSHKLKLKINAGHGICYNTIKAFNGLYEIDEFSIGHSIVSRAVLVGMERAVKEMSALIKEL